MPKQQEGQSLLEFAILVPILILILLGAAELTLFIGAYMNLVDLTREAARFASVRDPFKVYVDQNCGPRNPSDPLYPSSYNNSLYYDTACVFSPIQGSSSCTDASFCNGFNSTLFFKSDQDDILVSVFTVTNNAVTDEWGAGVGPNNGPWVWSDNDGDAAHSDNWKRSCDGTNPNETPNPYFTNARMNAYMTSANAPIAAKGFVVVEAYYCYHQVMKVPIVGLLFPDPMKLHVYTIMPLPVASPTATPIP
jgi:hypothetical protein